MGKKKRNGKEVEKNVKNVLHNIRGGKKKKSNCRTCTCTNGMLKQIVK